MLDEYWVSALHKLIRCAIPMLAIISSNSINNALQIFLILIPPNFYALKNKTATDK
jgi:hypothetical protein